MTPSPASLLLAAGVLLSLIGASSIPSQGAQHAALRHRRLTPPPAAFVSPAYGAVHREELSTRLQSFAASLESSPWGAAEFMAAYILCEMVGVPAVPLTMSSGAIFGPVRGTAIVSLAGLTAAGAAFLVARHLARDRFAHLLASSPKWQAVDSALGQHSFKVITLLRLSPLFPFALSNYAFGLTRLGFWPYIAGSWLGMLPGTAMYVYAGSLGRDVLTNGLSDVADLGVHSVPLVVGGLMAVGSAGLVGKLVADAMEQGGKQEQGAGDGKASDAAAPADEAQRDDALSGKR